VAQRQDDVHVGLGGDPPDQGGERSLHLRRVQGEESLELVEHEEGLRVRLAPAARVAGPLDLAHTACPEPGRHLIRTKAGTGGEGHGRGRIVASRQPVQTGANVVERR